MTEKVGNLFTHLTTENITVENTLCLDDVCITKDQLQELLNSNDVDALADPIEEEELDPDADIVDEELVVDEPVLDTLSEPTE